jgi:hypothetical protein
MSTNQSSGGSTQGSGGMQGSGTSTGSSGGKM